MENSKDEERQEEENPDDILHRLGLGSDLISSGKEAGKGAGTTLKYESFVNQEDVSEFVIEMVHSLSLLARDAGLDEMARDLDDVWRKSRSAR